MPNSKAQGKEVPDSDPDKLVGEAKRRLESVRDLRAKAGRRLRNRSASGAYLRIIELVEQQGVPALGTFSYLLIALFGLGYTWGYYAGYPRINIFSYFDTPDFFLSAFSNVTVLIVAFFVLALSLFLLGMGYWLLNYRQAYPVPLTRPSLRRMLPLPVILDSLLAAPVCISVLLGKCFGDKCS